MKLDYAPDTITTSQSTCYHCGEACVDEIIPFDEHSFCCEGCVTVYDLLKENDLCNYYSIDGAQGISPNSRHFKGKYDYLDLPEVSAKLIEFTDGKLCRVNWSTPKMHCSSCIWLLEQLNRLNPAIRASVVNFPEKSVRVTFDSQQIKLSEVAELLTNIGYEPYISLNDINGSTKKKWNKARLYKIGIAGFAFGNIMMLSFPEYFSLGMDTPSDKLRLVFDGLNIIFSLPVLFYCASDFFKSAWGALKAKQLNIDAPIALALLGIFFTSLYQIFSHTGPGYLDSLAGAVFFMLIGRYFQDKTYSSISFDRDYKSYFPIAVSVVHDDETEVRKPITELLKGDKILIRGEELIPVDAVLLSPMASIDYSFVSGEAEPVERKVGETIYAGGKHKGAAITLEVLKEVSQSYLTQLWNNDTFTIEKEDQNQTLAARINRYFSTVVMIISTITFIVWITVLNNPETAFRAFTTALLVACPCALLLSSTFTNGNLLALFGKHEFYPKNAHAIERLAHIDTVVFDKTGTITVSNDASVDFVGDALNEQEIVMVKTVAAQSTHPLSRMLVKNLKNSIVNKKALLHFEEVPGAGMYALFGANKVKMGSAKWVENTKTIDLSGSNSYIFISINDEIKGYFTIQSKYRPELTETVKSLQNQAFDTYLLSGDQPTDKVKLTPIFGCADKLIFQQKPEQKLQFIETLQNQKNRNVLMVGDGLNDAGALQQSNVGLAVSEDTNNFTPACDAIVSGKKLTQLPGFIQLAKSGQKIIKISFSISLIYNIIGLLFAVTGNLSPVVAAILMPTSSITIVAFTTLTTNIAAAKWLKN